MPEAAGPRQGRKAQNAAIPLNFAEVCVVRATTVAAISRKMPALFGAFQCLPDMTFCPFFHADSLGPAR
jgi:hypothetical protein